MENETKTEEAKTPVFLEEAKKLAERIEKANIESSSLLKQMQEIEAFKALGGKSEGRAQEVIKAEIDPRAYAKAALAGKIIPK